MNLKIPKEFYVSKEKRYLPIVIRVIAMSADRPERSTLNNMSGHSSHSAKRWMYSSLTDPHKMASCTQCYIRRIRKLYFDTNTNDVSQCTKCCDFDFSSTLPVNRFHCPTNYPTNASKIQDNINKRSFKDSNSKVIKEEFDVNNHFFVDVNRSEKAVNYLKRVNCFGCTCEYRYTLQGAFFTCPAQNA